MSANGRVGGCPFCWTSLGWSELAHDGVIHGRPAARGGPYFTLRCPACGRDLYAEGGQNVYRFSAVHREDGRESRWRRWVRALFLADEPPLREPPRRHRAFRPRREKVPPHPPERQAVRSTRVLRALQDLGLNEAATLDDVKGRFRALVKTCHPDVVPAADRAAAERRFVAISQAYREIIRSWSRA